MPLIAHRGCNKNIIISWISAYVISQIVPYVNFKRNYKIDTNEKSSLFSFLSRKITSATFTIAAAVRIHRENETALQELVTSAWLEFTYLIVEQPITIEIKNDAIVLELEMIDYDINVAFMNQLRNPHIPEIVNKQIVSTLSSFLVSLTNEKNIP